MDALGLFPIRIIFLAAVAAAAMLVSDPSEPTVDGLAYQSGGAPFLLSLHQAVNHAQVSNEGASEVRVEANLECRTVPLQSDDGAPRFEVHYDDVDLAGHAWRISSQQDTIRTSVDLPRGSDFGYEVEVSQDGNIRKIRRTGDRTLFPNARLYEERQNRFLAFLPHLFVNLPGRAGLRRNSWRSSSIEEVTTAEGVTALLRTTAIFRLTDLAPPTDPTDPIVRAEVDFQHEFAAADTTGASVGRLRESGGTGTLEFNTATGRIVSYAARDSAAFDVFDGQRWIQAHRSRETRLEAELTTTPSKEEGTGAEIPSLQRAGTDPTAIRMAWFTPARRDERPARSGRR